MAPKIFQICRGRDFQCYQKKRQILESLVDLSHFFSWPFWNQKKWKWRSIIKKHFTYNLWGCESYHVYELHIAKELGLGSSKNIDKKFWTCFLLLLSSFGFCLFTLYFLVVPTRQILFLSKTDSILIGWWILDMIHLKFSLRVEWIMDFVDFIPIGWCNRY